ncbi:hypothetical protein WNY78_02665 [Psychroserpens sp. AS72]|uniref:hypothetical protein n=1 Tax=Psychroserpens sp. AS72 TaxID=3135775 RepID=UPI0031757E97
MSTSLTKNKVIFYYPQHFNRDANNENPYLKPFLKHFESHNVAYKLVEEPDAKTIKPSNPKAVKFNLFIVLVLRKILPLFLFKDFEIREQFIGKLYRWFTANKYNAEVVFTLSNSLGGFWRGYNPKARIIDYQHGLINKKQTGFFNNGEAPLHISANNKEVAVWGRNFKKMFEQDTYYNNKVHVLGHFQDTQRTPVTINGRNSILFMLQFISGLGNDKNMAMLDLLKDVILQFKSLPSEDRPKIILKNHPRHNHILDLSEIFKEYEFVHILPDDSVINASEILIHITYFSTGAFEMAQEGVPTYFLYNKKIPQGYHIFFEDYNYPVQQKMSLLEFYIKYKNDSSAWKHNSDVVVEWASSFFEPFNTEKLNQLLNSKYDER